MVGLVHVALVASHYFVGSFDDDAGYILTAKALVAGGGLTTRLPTGEVIAGLYPPGYSALLAPLVWLWPHSFVPLRLLSTACFAALFPLFWVYLGRKGFSPTLRTAALTLLALGPPLATYGSMVMAEAPFLVLLLLLLLGVDTWPERAGVWARQGLVVMVLASALIWLKEAAVGLVVGLVLWYLWSRAGRRRAGALGTFVVVTLIPVIAARIATGTPVAGSRYSQELGGYYQGGLGSRLAHVVPSSGWHLLTSAIPATLVPYLAPLPIRGHWPDLWKGLSVLVAVLVVTGAVVWARRHRDAALLMTVIYLAESTLWPFVNERRAILVLPILIGWYVTGAAWAWTMLSRAVGRHRSRRFLVAGSVLMAGAVVVGPLVAQMPRDYLYAWGQSGSHFGGSRYASVLARLGSPTDVVETDYRSSTALFTGHQTNWNAFVYDQGPICYGPFVVSQLAADRADFLLLGDLNKPGYIDNPCLASLVAGATWAVEILHTARDDGQVYELLGPGTAQPGLTDVVAGVRPGRTTTPRSAVLTWSLPAPRLLSQLSVGEAAASAGTTVRVALEYQQPDGHWVVAASAPTAVGDGAGRAPYLLAALPQAVPVEAVRVVVEGPAPASGATVGDLAAIGPAAAAPVAGASPGTVTAAG